MIRDNYSLVDKSPCMWCCLAVVGKGYVVDLTFQ